MLFNRHKASLTKCYGGCHKHRIVLGGEPNDPSYFCKAYKQLFAHAEPMMAQLAETIRQMGYGCTH